MDKNGKIFGKINIIDLAAVLIVILAVIGITIRFTSIAAENVNQKANFTYVVEIEEIREYSVNALNKMGTATDKQGNVIGEIINVESEKFYRQIVNDNGEPVKVYTPERYVARVTLESEGKDTDGGYFVGENTELSVGSTINMHTKYSNCSGKIIKVQKQENQG